ncbi:NUDIX domain-containing protein [Reyranella sp.]|uniref:NUDIX domain-containing protein n=1 Tax=Reyranella sp. TaxID=1929291 RepID=UPI003BABE22A
MASEQRGEPLHPIGKKGPWTVLSAEDVYENPWIRVTHHEVLTPAGTPGLYGLVHYRNLAIGVVPVDAEGHTYLVGQYRFPLDAYSWEIPEGGGAQGVDPLDSAARELREETGLVARHWRKLLEADLSNSVSDERAVAYLAWGLAQGEAEPEATEELAVRRVPLAEAFRMVEAGEIRDALSVLSLQAVRLLQLEGKLDLPD